MPQAAEVMYDLLAQVRAPYGLVTCLPKETQMEYNPLLPEVRENPYPYYEELRRKHPVYPLGQANAWAVSRYEDVVYVLRNHTVFSSKRRAATSRTAPFESTLPHRLETWDTDRAAKR